MSATATAAAAAAAANKPLPPSPTFEPSSLTEPPNTTSANPSNAVELDATPLSLAPQPPTSPLPPSSTTATSLPPTPLPPSPLHLPPRALLKPPPNPHRPPRPNNRSHPSSKVPLESQSRATAVPHSKFSQAAAPRAGVMRSGRFPVKGHKQQQRSRSCSKFTEDFSDLAVTPGFSSSTVAAKEAAVERAERRGTGRTFGGNYLKEEIRLFDPEGGARLLTRRWGGEEGEGGQTRRTRVVFMGVGVVVVGGFVVVGLACSGVV